MTKELNFSDEPTTHGLSDEHQFLITDKNEETEQVTGSQPNFRDS